MNPIHKKHDEVKSFEGQHMIYTTYNTWLASENNLVGKKVVRIARVEEALDNFVKLAIVNHKGDVTYRECCNYASLVEGECALSECI